MSTPVTRILMPDPDGARSAGRRRRQRWVAGIAFLACIAILAAGWDAAAYLYFLHRFRSDPAALCAALFQGTETSRGRAARECLRAGAREAEFARAVAGTSWWARSLSGVSTLPGPVHITDGLRAVPSRGGYELSVSRRAGHRAQGNPVVFEETRTVAVWGPFLRDVEDPGRVDTWGVLDGKLIVGALLRLTPRDWILLRSIKFKDDLRHSLYRFSFDLEPAAGASGKCCWYSFHRSDPGTQLRVDVPIVDFATGREVLFDVVAAGGSRQRVLVHVGDVHVPRLHLDISRGVGWVEPGESVVYDGSLPSVK